MFLCASWCNVGFLLLPSIRVASSSIAYKTLPLKLPSHPLPALCLLTSGCVTLAAAHLSPSLGLGGMVTPQAPSETTLWSYLVQLTAVMRAVHAAGLALRPCCLHASKVSTR